MNQTRPHGLGVHSVGPWPFVTLRHYTHHGRRLVWRSRDHRKGLLPTVGAVDIEAIPVWQTAAYNWATGALFAIGAFFFMLGCVDTLTAASDGGPSAFRIAVIFFAGSIPFTTAAYLQHFQSANAGEFSTDPNAAQPRRIALIGWRPHNPGWLSTFTQFIGTIAFNFNTFDALWPPAGWLMQNLVIWLPDLIGCTLFLFSGYLAFIEAGHAYWSWRPKTLDWWIVFVNLVGCVFFMTSGILDYVPRHPEAGWVPVAATVQLWIGALGFFVGAVLLMRESRLKTRK
ncbi:hypothetical protein [Acuticoccus mangrovi]|uniref:YrhK domain-containing protein n=1 Tax=Acuticoccus mangrovi TaxID=2796142 RepID=A0A934MJ20_9HYPH|nr:hypothetical protein [Acuticoccus mangrovi]MBJ3778465.1 hypothetical protein [Acuticoccus mangrovi]